MANNQTKKPTRDDLLKAATAAATLGETFLAAANQGIADDPPKQMARGTRDLSQAQQQQPPAQGRTRTRERDGKSAFEEFMTTLRQPIRQGGNKLRVTDNAGFVKIESLRNGHKIYIAKTKTVVNRIESTIPPDMIMGALEPERDNGRIVSLLPADPAVITDAIHFLVESDERIPPHSGVEVTRTWTGSGKTT